MLTFCEDEVEINFGSMNWLMGVILLKVILQMPFMDGQHYFS